MMRVLDLDYVDLEVRAVELTGELTPEAIEVEVATGLAQRGLQRIERYMVENGAQLLVRFLVVLAILGIFWLLARVVRAIARKGLDRKEVAASQLLKEMIVSLSGRVVLAIGIFLALSQLGIDLGPLLAGLGIAGLVIGFALQDSLANFAAGAMILAHRPFDVGDLVETAGVLGNVDDMNLVSTRILTPDNQRLMVPNNKIWGDVIRNMTAESRRRVDLVFGIAYEDDIPQAEKLLAQIVSEHDKVLADPEPVIKLHTLNDSSVDFVVRPWVATEDYWEVYWDLTREVKLRFDDEGISIPYPQRDIHIIAAGSDADSEA
jgi:small conductance mechanosensitive channel